MPVWPDLPSRARPSGCRQRLALVAGALALAWGVAASDAVQVEAPHGSTLWVIGEYMLFVGVGFWFGCALHIAELLAKGGGDPIDPRALLMRSFVGGAAGFLGLVALEATVVDATRSVKILATASAAIGGYGYLRLRGELAQRGVEEVKR